ncbi:MAG TPA: chemotaxis protein CheD [bacterium]|nr:chemotaxis protein CheD [bacterium]
MIGTQSKVHTIGVADMKVSDDPDSTLVTYSLGSCLGIVIYDPVAKVGGLLHVMLPEANENKNSKGFNPCKYVDTGVPVLFKKAYKYGAKKNRMIVAVTGGSQILDESGFFNIGKRNLASLRKLFWKNGVMVDKEHVEGNVARTVRLNILDGAITVSICRDKVIIL